MLRKILSASSNGVKRIGSWISIVAWYGVGLWAALAAYFCAPLPGWLAALLAIGIAGPFVAAQRERNSIRRWLKTSWRDKRFTTASVVVAILVASAYFGLVKPDPNLDWAPEQSRVPEVTIDGNYVHVRDVRNFTWHTATDFTPGFYDRTYDVDKLDSMYYVVASMPSWEGVAHVFVCFGFSDGQNVAVSVEGRRIQGQTYRVIPSMFRQFQLIYVVGDECDVVGLRGAIWKKPVFFYPARTTNERKRAIFLSMMRRAHSLEKHPEFYHLITNNCMNNIRVFTRICG